MNRLTQSRRRYGDDLDAAAHDHHDLFSVILPSRPLITRIWVNFGFNESAYD